MTLEQFNKLVGQDSYVRCRDKKRLDTAVVSVEKADAHTFSGGQIGWWVRTGYIVVDIDEGQEQALKVIKALKLKTLICRTPKGLHLYFKTTKDFPQKVGMILPCGLKCDYRCANKGYVLLPFGASDRAFNKVSDIADMPIEFTPIPNRKDSLLGLKEGDGRNATLFAHLMAYKNRGASDDQITSMADAINQNVFSEPMAQSELDKIVENTKKYEANEQGENPYLIYNSKGQPANINARAICDYFVNCGDVFVMAGECYRYINGVYTEASSYVRNTIKEMIVADTLITHSRILECYRLLIDDVRIQREAKSLNSDKNLINFENGVWDIEQRKLLPHDSKFLQTIQVPHALGDFKKLENTKLYEFLVGKCGIKNDDLKMILSYLAYCLTLSYGLKTFMILQGGTNTGKSVLIRFVEKLVGKVNTSSLSMHELNMRFYPTQLHDKLLNACADNSSLPLSSIDTLKKITGGDSIMYEKKGNPNIFFFVPFAKLLFSFNQMPLQLEEKSNAFYKRMRVLKMDKELYLNDEYVAEVCSEESVCEIIPYLLSLLPLDSIPNTESSSKIVEGLRQDSDSMHAFFTKKCTTGNSKWASKKGLYELYVQFCIDNGREAHKKHSFIRHMRSQGFVEARHPETREACWKGIGLRRKKDV